MKLLKVLSYTLLALVFSSMLAPSVMAAKTKALQRSVGGAYKLAPPGYNDEDDESSLPYLLSTTELKKLGLSRKTQIFMKFDPTTIKILRAQPVYKVRIHAVRTANSNGSQPATITPAQIKSLVDQANIVWWSSGIEFIFDPNKDFEHINNTLLNQLYPLVGFEAKKHNPNWNPYAVDNSIYQNAKKQLALNHRGELVVFFMYGTKFKWDENEKVWKVGPVTGGASGSNSEYVRMPKGMPEKNLLAHEIGHYMHLPHTHVVGIKTVDDATQAIRDWVENKNHPSQEGLLAFDGDNGIRNPGLVYEVKDTPPDAAGSIFVSKYGEGANCAPSPTAVYLYTKFSNGYQALYTLEPDRLNIMSYFKHCHKLGTHHLSKEQIKIVRAALENGNRHPLLIHTLKPGVLKKMPKLKLKSK